VPVRTLGPMNPVYFTSTDELRAWFDTHHADETELLVGYYKRGTDHPTISWSQSVDQALCFGWIDSQGRRVDDQRWCVRFTPRKAGSIWSAVNVAKVAELTAAGLMTPAGLRAFEARRADRTGVYSHERAEDAVLDDTRTTLFQAVPGAWEWFTGQAPSYRRAAVHWVLTAKQQTTRDRRLRQLIDDSAAGRTVPPLTRHTGRPTTG
jgi:uncharacterized protein YdeI (YjbR/CyaY-like superfamily)